MTRALLSTNSQLPTEQLLVLAADVTDEARMRRVVGRAVDRFGRLDVVFANAGIGPAPRRLCER